MKPNVQRRFKLFRKRKKLNGLKNENIDDILEKKLKEYYNNIDTEAPSSFENAIQTAFSSKRNKKFLLLIAKKQNVFEKLKHFKERISKRFTKVSQLAVALFCTLCVTYFVHATSFVDYLLDVFNLNDTDINNSGIEQALQNGNLQNVYMDYIRENGVGVKISYVLMNDLNLYLVFDIETDFSLNEVDVSKLNFQDLTISNENNEIIFDKYSTDIFKGNKVIMQDEHHMKNLVFIMSDNILESNQLNIQFSNIIFYKNISEEQKNLEMNEHIVNLNFTHSIKMENIESKIAIYDVKEKEIQNSNIEIKKVILDESGINLLILSNNFNFDIKVKTFFEKYNVNSYYIKRLEDNRKEFIVNIVGIKEKDKINLEIESGDKVNKYELIKNR